MSWVLLLILMALLLTGTPIFIAMLSATLAVTWYFVGLPLEGIMQRVLSGIDKFSLLAIPLFIFSANIMRIGGLSARIISLSQALVGHLPGGMALTTIVACMMFGAVSGSSPATVVAIGGIVLPALKEARYSEQFSVGLITSSASVALIIPPSIGMIVYGVVTGTSVGDLFLAGIIPGLLLGATFMAYSFAYAVRHRLPLAPAPSLSDVWSAFCKAGWALGVPVVIIGGIYGGIFTPTEAAAVACIYAIAVTALVYREMSPRRLIDCAIESAVGTAQIMILVGAASGLAWLLTIEQVPQQLSGALLGISESTVIILLMMNLILIVAGMFIDPTSITMIFAPIFLPISLSMGISPIHLGLILVVNSAIGMYTPPFGFNLFVASGISKLSIDRMVPGVMPFILCGILAVIVITFVPQLSLWLPELFR
ncbi:TRAP transporter large permease [Antarctobacter sp.]|uniref:TRAP transporter large permease n=1 Tax=Antarctobacter sp. TaxID=1872577 RepID=UPI002B2727F2|nr:TRAP transporter large permease [Antarctobacter sp.]